MKKVLGAAFMAAVVWCAAVCAPQEKMPRVIPMKDFFRNPEMDDFQLSPDGQYLAFVKPWQTRRNIHVQKIGETEERRITSATERDIAWYCWASNGRIAYIKDKEGDFNYRLYAVNIDGSDEKDLTPYEKVRVQIVDEIKDDDDHVLIAMNKRDPRFFDAYRINVLTGDMELVAENPGNIMDWRADHNGQLRVVTTYDGVNTSLLYRDTEKDDFRVLQTTGFKETLRPLFFTYDNRNLYVVTSIGRDKAAVCEYDVKKRELTTLLYENPNAPVQDLLKSDKRKVVTGVVYYTDKRQYHFLDAESAKLQQDIESRLSGYEVSSVGMSRDETKVLIYAGSDRNRGAYYLYDRTTSDFRKLADVCPWLIEAELADMKPITYTSREGLAIHGYLTLPRGLKPKKLPVVVNPHGGPWTRNGWGYNPEVQFLANRGYAVLQVNFRASTGYGRKFWEAGFKQWGLKIQDDITDGVKWLIDQGIADPKRIGIYGLSFGGYATLAGLAFTPDLYACGVDYAGVSNLFTYAKTFMSYGEPARQMLYEMMGDPEKDKEYYEKVSPVFHTDNIKAPLLVAQGANDVNVNRVESDQIVEALRKRGIEVVYMVKDNEAHGFRNEENRFDFYRAMEEFLGTHLGGRVEARK